MSTKHKATSLDIAHLAGVSQATVSRALRGSALVSDDTRRRVQAAARQLHYTIDKNASNLRSRHCATLALLISEDPTADDSHINPFFLSMLGSITRACAQQGHDLLISFQQLSEDWHADYVDSKKADGIVLLGYGDYLAYRHKLQSLLSRGTPAVRWGAAIAGQPETSIGCDNVLGGQLVTQHLFAQGCRRIAFVGTVNASHPEFAGRHQGYLTTHADAGVATDGCLQFDASSTEQAGYEATCSLLNSGQAFDALFAASDLIAIGAMRALAEAGRSIPGEVAVAGFDDVPMARFMQPPLTTVLQDTTLAGELLVRSLLQQIQGEPVDNVTLPIRLVVRGSSTG